MNIVDMPDLQSQERVLLCRTLERHAPRDWFTCQRAGPELKITRQKDGAVKTYGESWLVDFCSDLERGAPPFDS